MLTIKNKESVVILIYDVMIRTITKKKEGHYMKKKHDTAKRHNNSEHVCT